MHGLERQQKQDHIRSDLSMRHSPSELESSGVVKSTKMAPSLQGSAAELQKSQTKDAVAGGFKQRKTPNELKDSGVMHSSTMVLSFACVFCCFCCFFFCENNKRKQKHKHTNTNKKKQKAPSLQGAAKQLEKQQKTDHVGSGLKNRPDANQLVEQGKMQPNKIVCLFFFFFFLCVFAKVMQKQRKSKKKTKNTKTKGTFITKYSKTVGKNEKIRCCVIRIKNT